MDAQSGSVLRHVVLFAFKADAGDKVQEVVEAFRRLPGLIPQIKSFEWGTDVSVENIQQGFTHCFLLGFTDAPGRDEYLVHPDHQAFGRLVQPVLEKVLVVDYWVQDAQRR
jgi:hypothetical protein